LFAGVLMAADWMASGFAFAAGDANALATDVLRRTVWAGWHSGASTLSLLEGRDPRPAQIGTLALPIDERFAVIEAPTGTGKTVAALIWASRLVEAGEVDELYFAVPTRSAASELHGRIGRLMSAHHPALKERSFLSPMLFLTFNRLRLTELLRPASWKHWGSDHVGYFNAAGMAPLIPSHVNPCIDCVVLRLGRSGLLYRYLRA
jgi:hypothetical protein